MSTQAASTRPMNRPAADVQNRQAMQDRQAMQETPTRPMPVISDGHREQMPQTGTETKQAFLTTEFWIYAVVMAGVVIAAFWGGSDTNGLNLNNPVQSWWIIAALTAGYLVSRGLSKAGSPKRSLSERRTGRR